MRSDVLRRSAHPIVEKDIAVGCCFRLDQRDEALVPGGRSELVTVDVLVQHRSGVPVGRDLVQIEVARIALVCRHQKRPIVAGPPVEVGLQLRPRRQVSRAPVRILDEDVRQLIPTLIARIEEPLIGREIGQGEDRVRRRRGQRYSAHLCRLERRTHSKSPMRTTIRGFCPAEATTRRRGTACFDRNPQSGTSQVFGWLRRRPPARQTVPSIGTRR